LIKIGIDARFLGPEGTGIGRYVKELIEGLQEIDRENRYFIFIRSDNQALFIPRNPNFKKIIVNARWYTLREQVLMPLKLIPINLDILHIPHFNIPVFYPGKIVVTIHDLIKTEFATSAATSHSPLIYKLKHSVYEFVIRLAAKRALKIFVPSETVKEKLNKILKVSKRKIIVTYEGVGENFKNKKLSDVEIRQVLYKYGVSSPYFLYVGNSYPYKNLKLILETLKIIKLPLRFVFVSSRDIFSDELLEEARNLQVEKNIILTGFVSDEDLAALYQGALFFVFPSLSEGFGIPGLEAFAAKIPLLASSIPTFREVYGKAALYFDPLDPNDLAKKIEQISEDKNLRDLLIEAGLKELNKYSWLDLARKTLETYREVS